MVNFVLIKIGGEVIRKNLENVLNKIAEFNNKVVLVHGGREIVNSYCIKMGIEPKFVISPEGIKSRYTTLEELEVYVMVMKFINSKITSFLNAKGFPSIGISGVDGNFILAKKKEKLIILNEKGRKQLIEGGYTGKIIKVNNDLLELLSTRYNCIVVSPIALDTVKSCMLNVDSDQVASEIAKSMNISKVIFLTDVSGLIINGNILREVSFEDIPNLIKETGIGMNRKLTMIYEAMKGGVKEVIVTNGLAKDFVEEIQNGNATVFKK